MSTATTMPFEGTVRTTNARWKHPAGGLGRGDDHHRAYHALRAALYAPRAVLYALRDRFRAREAADLEAQLPVLVRGFYRTLHVAAAPSACTCQFHAPAITRLPAANLLKCAAVKRAAIFRGSVWPGGRQAHFL